MIAVVDKRTPQEACAALEQRGFQVLPLPAFSRLAAPVASHPDLLMLPLGDRIFVHKKYYAENSALIERLNRPTRRLCPVDSCVEPEYPHDTSLDLLPLGQALLGRLDCAPVEVTKYALAQGYTLVPIRQGYAKCSAVVLGDQAVISADPSVLKAAQGLGLDTLAVSPGGVSLPGYNYGFLGGASGVIENTVLFCGDILSHPNGQSVVAFCARHGFKVHSLSPAPLLDIGSIFFFD